MDDLLNNFITVLKKYSDFRTRSSRREYWLFAAVNFIISLGISLIFSVIFSMELIATVISGIYSLLVFVPSLAVTVRRLHDVGKSGWTLLLTLIPIVGWLYVLYLLIKVGDIEPNQWGEIPLDMPPQVDDGTNSMF